MTGDRQLLFLSTAVGSGRDANAGGGEHFASEFIQAIAARGWRVTLACPPSSPLWWDSPLVAALQQKLPLDLSAKVESPLRFGCVVARWLWEACRFRSAVVYANGYESMKWGVMASRLYRQPVVCHLHESTYGPYSSRRARTLAPNVERFFAISKDVRRGFIAGTGIDGGKVSVVYNGIHVSGDVSKDPELRQSVRREFGIDDQAKLVLMAARTDIHKGHQTFIEAANHLLPSSGGVAFLIVGLQRKAPEEEALFDRVTAWITEQRLDNTIKFTGYRSDVRRLMRAADIVVVPSTSEGFGRTAVEAMAEKTAVVASRVGGLAEIITSGEDGVHFSPGDSEALANALVPLLQDDALRNQLAARGYRTALERFSLESMCDSLETHLLCVLKERA